MCAPPMRHHRPTYTPAMILRTLVAWSVTLFLFFPFGWMALTAFKTELQAIAVPPLVLFEPTLENFTIVQERSDYMHYALKHERNPTSLFMDKYLANSLQKFAVNNRDYENMYVMTKKLAHLANNQN